MAGPSSTFRLAPGESFVQCPYNKAHMITNARILVHLNKCRSNYQKEAKSKGIKVDIVPCAFNFAHQIHKPELEFHQATCQDQHNIVGHIEYHQSEEFKAKAQAQLVAKYENDAKADDEGAAYWEGGDDDNWETESKGNAPGYDPNVRLQQGPVVPIVPQGMTKSERKTFRNNERLRQEEYLKKEMSSTKFEPKPKQRKVFGDDPYVGEDPFVGEDPYA